MKFSVLVVLVMCWAVVTCEETQREDEAPTNHLSERQVENFQKSLFNIFERLGNSLNMNQTTTDEKTGNTYNNLNIIKSLTLHIHLNANITDNTSEGRSVNSSPNVADNNSEILERMAKLETIANTLLQNQKTIDDNLTVLSSNVSDFASNTRKLPETVPEDPVDPCKTASTSGMFRIQQLNQNVYCETTTFGGRWMVFQQRFPKKGGSYLSFHRTWAEYRAGFGTIGQNSEYWLGLETMHQVTTRGEYELAVEMKDHNGKYGYARYSQFRVAGEDDKYRLTIGGYSGTAGDALKTSNGMKFTTIDSDNDNYAYNCVVSYWNDGGWWFNDCYSDSAPNYGLIHWPGFVNWSTGGTFFRMMIRRK